MKNIIYFKRFCIATIAWFFSCAFTTDLDFIILPAETPVIINLETPIEEDDLNIGQIIKFNVEQSVIIKYQKLINNHAAAYGKVTQTGNGKITIEMKWVQAVDDTQVPISGTFSGGKKCRKCQATIEAGTKIEATVKENIKISLTGK